MATPAGRDEIDLMKLIVKKPAPDDGGNVKLTVKVSGVPAEFVESFVKLWKHSTKKEPFDMPNGTVDIPTSELDKTLWVEARVQSSGLRDIEIELDYKGCKDVVKATAVWAEMTGFRNSQITKTLTANAAAGQNKINVNNATGLQAGSHVIIFRGTGVLREGRTIASMSGNEITLTANLANAYNTDDEVREGASRLASSAFNESISDNGGGKLGSAHVSPHSRNGMEMEFTLEPPGIGSDTRLVWDITRQMESVGWDYDAGGGPTVPSGYPTSWPTKVEEPNDDNQVLDEDNAPNQDKIYSSDFPGFFTDIAFGDRRVRRHNFYEFVRARIGGAFTNSNGLIEGSRCSDRVAWRSRLDLTRDAVTGRFQRNGADNKIILGHEALGSAP